MSVVEPGTLKVSCTYSGPRNLDRFTRQSRPPVLCESWHCIVISSPAAEKVLRHLAAPYRKDECSCMDLFFVGEVAPPGTTSSNGTRTIV